MWFVFSLHSMSPDYFYNKTKEEQEPKNAGALFSGFRDGGSRACIWGREWVWCAFSLTLGLWDVDTMFAPGSLSPRWREGACPSENASCRLGRVNLFLSQASFVRERKQIWLHPMASES